MQKLDDVTAHRTMLTYEEYFAQRKHWTKKSTWCLVIAFTPGALLYLSSALIERASKPPIDSDWGALLAVLLFTQFVILFAASIYCGRKAEAVDESVENPLTLEAFRDRYEEDHYIGEGHPWYPLWRGIGWICGSLMAVLALSLCFWLMIETALLYMTWPTSLKVLCALLLAVIAGGYFSKTVESILFEDVETFNAKRVVRRLTTNTILVSSLLCIPFGIWLLTDEIYVGATLIFTICPCLLLYPLIRTLFFGGKDSVAGVVTTVIVEEVTKAGINSAIKKMTEKDRRGR